MALQPTGPTIDHPLSAQESMFEDHADFSVPEEYESLEEQEPVASASEEADEPDAATVLTVDDFAALEERVLRAVNLVRRERDARIAAEERAAALEAQLQAQNPAVERLQQEVSSLRTEREQVRQRVERLLSQLDALEL